MFHKCANHVAAMRVSCFGNARTTVRRCAYHGAAIRISCSGRSTVLIFNFILVHLKKNYLRDLRICQNLFLHSNLIRLALQFSKTCYTSTTYLLTFSSTWMRGDCPSSWASSTTRQRTWLLTCYSWHTSRAVDLYSFIADPDPDWQNCGVTLNIVIKYLMKRLL